MGYSNDRKRVFPAVVLHYHCRRETKRFILGQIGNAFQRRPRFSRKNAFLQAEISGIDLHAVIFMVEQAEHKNIFGSFMDRFIQKISE